MRNAIYTVLVTLACAGHHRVPVGQFNLDADDWGKCRATINSRAAFELKCPAEQLTLTVLSQYYSVDDMAGQVGVEGCGQRLVYVRAPYDGGWVLNSSNSEKK